VKQRGGKPPHSKMGWAWMLGAIISDQVAGSAKSNAPAYNSRGRSFIYVVAESTTYKDY
jgi:hypothetical protein